MNKEWRSDDPPEEPSEEWLDQLAQIPPEEARGALSEAAKATERQAAHDRRTAEQRYWQRGDFWWRIVAALMMAAVVALAVGSILGRR